MADSVKFKDKAGNIFEQSDPQLVKILEDGGYERVQDAPTSKRAQLKAGLPETTEPDDVVVAAVVTEAPPVEVKGKGK